jgi:flagellar hook-length control protein FliK
VPSVASQVTASINQHRDAKASASANGKDRNASSPFEEMLDSAGAAEDPAPSTKDAAPAKASKGNAATEGKKTQSADDAAASDDAAPAQASDLERDEAARGESAEGTDATLADLVSKELTPDAGDGAVPQQPQDVAPVEKPIADIGLAVFLEAVAAATTPQPEAEDAKDEPQKAEAHTQADADTPASVVTGPVKADAIAAAVVTMTTEAAADAAAPPSDAQSTTSGKMTPVAGASPVLPEAAAPVEHGAGSQNLGKDLPADAEAADVEASLAVQTEAPKPRAEAHKHRAETTAQHSEAPKLVAGASKIETAAATEPEAPAPHPSHVTHRHAEIAEAKPAQAGVSPAEAPAPAKPADAPQMLQTLPQMTAPTVGAILSLSVQKDVTPMAAAVPIEGVAVEIAAKASEGMKTFEIRLDPPELGRIHVRLDVDRNGEITSRVMADRQDTLDLLRRDAPQLERALNDAGLRTSNNGLQFSLRDQGQSQQQQQQQQQQALPNAARLIIPDESLAAELTQRGYHRPAGSAGGIDIRV